MPFDSTPSPKPTRYEDGPLVAFGRKVAIAGIVLVLELISLPPREWVRLRREVSS
jgi:hypothetical protein